MATDTFFRMFEKQAENQRNMFEKGMYYDFSDNPAIDGEFTELPLDDPKLCSYHIQQLVSYDKDAKRDEIADCFIVLMNIAMFSGFDATDMYYAISKKIEEVSKRISDVN